MNLLGWVTLALYALFYQAVPAATAGWLPRLHFGLATVGPDIMYAALAHPAGDHGGLTPLIAVGALMTFGSMIGFGAVVIDQYSVHRARALTPAS